MLGAEGLAGTLVAEDACGCGRRPQLLLFEPPTLLVLLTDLLLSDSILLLN